MGIMLVVIGTLLILLNVKAIKKEDNSFSSILKREESVTNRDYDVEIISIRKDLAESILDIQKEMQEIRELIIDKNNMKNKINFLENDEENIENDDSINSDIINSIGIEEVGVISQIDFSNKSSEFNKVDEVKRLVVEGLTDEEICKKLSIGKGEVLLIKGLFKN